MKRVALLLAAVVLGAATPPPPQSLYSLPGTWVAPQTYTRGTVASALRYDARAFGSCTWDNAHDVGPCINLAIAAASAIPGSSVVLPAGKYGWATPLVIGTTGVSLMGQGAGIAVDNNASNLVPVTELSWIGSASAGPGLDVEPSGLQSLYGVNVWGIAFNCANLVDVCVKFEQTSASWWNILASDARLTNIMTTTEPSGFVDAPGTQVNEIWFQSRSTSNTYSPTGILLDQGAGSSFNTSLNHIHLLSAVYAKGDGIVIAGTDNNVIEHVATTPILSSNSGTPLVLANAKYVPPSGVAVNAAAGGGNIFGKVESGGVVNGFLAGSTITPGANSGTAAVTTVSLTTNAQTALQNATLNFASTTGALIGMTASCGSWACGIPPGTPVISVTGTTVVLGLSGGVAQIIPTSTAITFSYGVTVNAVAGTYTMTAVDGTHWTLTAPSGGHNQTNVAVASNAISFTDMVIPLSGTPVANDTFSIVVPVPVINQTFQSVDTGNDSIPIFFENGASGWQATVLNPYLVPYGGAGDMKIAPYNVTNGCVQLGGFPGQSAVGCPKGGMLLGGFASGGQGQGGVASGHATVVDGTYAQSWGEFTRADGYASRAAGVGSTVRTRYAADCWASGELAAQGDAQTCVGVLHGTGASTSALPLTADGLTAGSTNCINIPNNTAYAITLTLAALDHTTVTKNETWLNWGGLLTRGANAASTALTMQSTPTPISNGTVTGSAIAASADTTNGCLTLTFTPPSGNTDTWNAVARVTTIEVQ